ncbi:hypothetical protein HCQ94_04565 [Actinomyces sp. zg-332]|uniref:hypothetical protein n=1 Tax=Actinomyces sp. zg-332 TaxID=2708340 RepID=UPI00142465C9|nr:hypothetical protein [Actinomyces sp. zg-332]QPK93862.1 hypothetical protein HCQ94_04565 [Actinomyces sp. zg-332]
MKKKLLIALVTLITTVETAVLFLFFLAYRADYSEREVYRGDLAVVHEIGSPYLFGSAHYRVYKPQMFDVYVADDGDRGKVKVESKNGYTIITFSGSEQHDSVFTFPQQ